MNQVAIVYWTSTGNTEAMANCIAEGVTAAGGSPTLLTCDKFSAADLEQYPVVAFGCSAMGCEQLDESEFEPMFASLEGQLTGKKVALFGSYGWGDGQWMRDWCQRTSDDGALLYEEEGLMVNGAPDAEGEERCRTLGRSLANW
jgi:flavodoxin short chain